VSKGTKPRDSVISVFLSRQFNERGEGDEIYDPAIAGELKLPYELYVAPIELLEAVTRSGGSALAEAVDESRKRDVPEKYPEGMLGAVRRGAVVRVEPTPQFDPQPSGPNVIGPNPPKTAAAKSDPPHANSPKN
jgi:hypothetical protein